MAFSAAEIFRSVSTLINDDAGVRWPFPERRRWLNDGLSEIVTLKPSAASRTIVRNLRSGTFQTIPNDAFLLARAIRNLATDDPENRVGGPAVKMVSRVDMDAIDPEWHDESVYSRAKVVRNVIYDAPTDPNSFYVWPPNNGGGNLELVVARRPTPTPFPTGPSDVLDSYNGMTVDLDDIYRGALTDYVCYRCLSKDAEHAGIGQRAASHYAAMANTLGVKLTNEQKFQAPRTYAERAP